MGILDSPPLPWSEEAACGCSLAFEVSERINRVS